MEERDLIIFAEYADQLQNDVRSWRFWRRVKKFLWILFLGFVVFLCVAISTAVTLTFTRDEKILETVPCAPMISASIRFHQRSIFEQWTKQLEVRDQNDKSPSIVPLGDASDIQNLWCQDSNDGTFTVGYEVFREGTWQPEDIKMEK